MALYQDIMTVPGLTGTWQQRNAQYYKALGSPMGAYKGTLQQNLYLLDQIKKKNFPQAPAPAPQPAATPTATPQQTLAQQYTDPLTGQLKSAAEIPQYENVMPFYDAWGRMIPQATIAAESQINPESLRNYNSAYGQYMSGMTSAGGQRFGRALGEVGNIKATAERDRLSQLQDWLNAYQTGYKDLFYNPSRDAWNKARTQVKPGGTMEATPAIPSWDDVYQKYNAAYGVQGAQTPQAGFVGGSPFYPTQPSPPRYGGVYQPPKQTTGGASYEPWTMEGISYDEFLARQNSGQAALPGQRVPIQNYGPALSDGVAKYY
jgi:hypothetical protein